MNFEEHFARLVERQQEADRETLCSAKKTAAFRVDGVVSVAGEFVIDSETCKRF